MLLTYLSIETFPEQQKYKLVKFRKLTDYDISKKTFFFIVLIRETVESTCEHDKNYNTCSLISDIVIK